MGKQHRKKTSRQKPCPTGLPTVREMEEEAEMSSCPTESNKDINSNIQSLVRKLQNPVAEEREVGCCTLLNLLCEPEYIKSILESEIVKIVMCLLQDSSNGVKNAAAGVLRNLSAFGAEVCEVLISEDVMTPLVAILHQYGVTYVPTRTSDGKSDTFEETFLQLIHLTWNLCEANNVALGIFNKHGIVNILSRCLDLNTFGNEIPIAAAHCLYSVTEDNPDCADVLSQPAMMQTLQEILTISDSKCTVTFLKTPIAGIIINIHESKNRMCPLPLLTNIFNALVETISHDIKNSIMKIASFIKEQKPSKKDKCAQEVTIETNELAALKTNFEEVYTAQQLALEILTNLCSSNDDEDEWGDIGSSDASDDIIQDDDFMECDAAGPSSDNINNLGFVSSEVHDAIIQHNLPARVLQQSTFPEQDVVQFLKSHTLGSDVIKKFAKQSSRSLLCFHNMVSSLSIEELGGTLNVYQTWLQLAEQMCSPDKPLDDTDLMEAQSSVLRALITKLAENKQPLYKEFASSSIILIVKACNKFISDHIFEASSRVNVIRTLGILGSILIGDNGVNLASVEPIVKDIGKFLVDALNKEQELWVLAETVDTIFDLFSEDYMDSIGNSINLIERLKYTLPLLKAKINSQRKSIGSHYPVIITAKDNLPQFIKYKLGRQSNDC